MNKEKMQGMVANALQEEYDLTNKNMNNKYLQLKKWYFILTVIWVAFWILNILVLIPLYPESGIGVNLINLVSEPDDLSFVWTLVTFPIQLYLAWLFIVWIFRRVLKK